MARRCLIRTLLAIACSLAATTAALAGSSATVTPIDGALGIPFPGGWTYDFGDALPPDPSFNLYNNIPSVLGGAAVPPFQCGGPFGSLPCGPAFIDWAEPSARYGDDVHLETPAVVTRLWYAYVNTLASTTHVVKLYDMVPPSVVPPVTTLIQKGALLASVVVPTLPSSTTVGFAVEVTGLSIALPNSALWVKFEEAGPGFPGTYWMTGFYPGIGHSHPGLLHSDGDENLWFPLPYIYHPDVGYIEPNISFGLGGYIPSPATIGLLALGGLITLRRRRGAG